MARFPYEKALMEFLDKHFDADDSLYLMEKTISDYDLILQNVSKAEHGKEWGMFQKRIAPGVAFYKALRAQSIEKAEAINYVDGFFRVAFFLVQKRGIQFLNILPNPFPLIRFSLRMMSRSGDVIVEDSKDCFAMDVTRCYYFDMMQRYEVPELTVCYCRTDDWLSEIVPSVHWIRKGTLAEGSERCDFRWCSPKVGKEKIVI